MKLRNYLVALLIVAIASAMRAVFFADLGRGIPYLTYFPSVTLAALYGGLHGGFLATAVSALLSFYWIQMGYMSPVETMAMGVFIVSSVMISAIAEAMHRAQTRARKAQEQAEAASRAKSVFLASMSHELRTPLNAILGFSGLLRNEAGISAEQRRTLDLINRSGAHLLTLINDVLDMAKIEAGRLSVESAPFDLGQMTRDVVDLMRVRAEENDLQLVLDQSPAFPRLVRGDATKLRQSLINLLGNAIKFTVRGSVTLRLDARPGDTPQRVRLIIEVRDTGIGIAAEDQQKLFQPFAQISQASQNTLQKGSGLGLAITRQYVELMGGRISLESSPGEGSCFRIELPAERTDETEVDAARVNRARVIGVAPGQPEYRILIVEDQMENWLLLQRVLEGAGLSVRVAENGQLGVEMFQSWRPHFIWMDLRMPVLDGLKAARHIRVLEGGREVKIAALTASVFKEERDRVIAAGMDDFVSKPFQPEEVFDCLARNLSIKFVREESVPGIAARPAAALNPSAWASLPEALRLELRDALVCLDGERITQLAQRIAQLTPSLGETLMQHAERLDYTVMLQFVTAGTEDSTQSTQGAAACTKA